MSDDRPVVVSDPGVRFGDPCVRGVSTNDLAELWVAGWTQAEILDEHDLTRAHLLTALWFEGRHGQHPQWRQWADEVAYPVLSGWDKRYVDEVPMPPIGSAVSGATCPSP